MSEQRHHPRSGLSAPFHPGLRDGTSGPQELEGQRLEDRLSVLSTRCGSDLHVASQGSLQPDTQGCSTTAALGNTLSSQGHGWL